MPYDVREVILSYLEEWRDASMKVKKKSKLNGVISGWSRPSKDFFKINVDGARSSDGSIGIGCVLRDCDGSWCACVMARMGAGEVILAEAWALYHGLQMGQREGVRHVEVESDSAVLVNLVLNADISNHPMGTMVLMCRQLMEGFAVCSLKYVPRVVNVVADSIAKASLSCRPGVHHLRQVPAFCAETVLVESGAMVHHKEISSSRSLCSSSSSGDVLVASMVKDAGDVARWCRLPDVVASYQPVAGSARATVSVHWSDVDDDDVYVGR